jgi:hypothetical protein
VLLSADGTVTFTNLTTHEAATVSVPIDSTNIGLSAEWIAEESGHCPLPLDKRPYFACCRYRLPLMISDDPAAALAK